MSYARQPAELFQVPPNYTSLLKAYGLASRVEFIDEKGGGPGVEANTEERLDAPLRSGAAESLLVKWTSVAVAARKSTDAGIRRHEQQAQCV